MGSQSRCPNYPKDAQVIMSILKDMGVADYEQRVLNQLLEFTYRYVTCILDDSRAYATHAKKKTIDLEDVKLAVNMQLDRSFTTPPPREILLEVARLKNSQPLPVIKPSCGIRLPPDRYCLSACNYKLKSGKKPQVTIPGGPLSRLSSSSSLIGGPLGGSIGAAHLGGSLGGPLTVQTGLKLQSTIKTSSGTLSVVKRGMLTTVPRTQTITIPKPVIKFSSGESSRLGDQIQQGASTAPKPAKPRIQFGTASGTAQGVDESTTVGSVTSIITGVKRPREDDD